MRQLGASHPVTRLNMPTVTARVPTNILAITAWIAGFGLSPRAEAQEPPLTPAPRANQRVLSLKTALDTAARHQPLLRQARATTNAARGRVEQARSGYLPQVTATASYERTTGNFTPRPGAFGFRGP